jgi:hypothetical protein
MKSSRGLLEKRGKKPWPGKPTGRTANGDEELPLAKGNCATREAIVFVALRMWLRRVGTIYKH